MGEPYQRADSQVWEQSFAVRYAYPVHFTDGVLEPANPTLAAAISRLEPHRRHRLVAVVDRGVLEAWPGLLGQINAYVGAHASQLDLVAAPEVVAGGEAVKNDPQAPPRLQARMQSLGIDRQSVVLIIGGGAVLDMAGYAAATTHRGVRVVRVPTTVLAQNDSGVGVKNGINAYGTKNYLGSFAPPFAVVNDIQFIETLAPRDRRSGMAEAVKVALIRDRSLFEWLADHADQLAAFQRQAMATMIRHSAVLHLRHIATSGDPFEQGSARPLDFGHWAAHKLEALSEYRLRHGEAVAIGVALDARYSVDAGLLGAAADEAICSLLERLGFRLWDETLDLVGADGQPRVLDGLEEFRQHLGGALTVTLLAGLGRGVEVHEMDADRIARAIHWLRAREPLR